MTTAGRPAPVRRWLHLPLWFGLAALALAAALVVDDFLATREQDRLYDRGHRVTAEVDQDWEGERDVQLSYRHPVTGETVDTAAYVWDTGRLPDSPGPVEVEVARDDPMDVVLAGDRRSATSELPNYAPWALLPFVIWLVRRHTVRRTERLMAADTSTYAMTARAVPPSWWGRRWRLRLHPLDTAPTSPVCAVPLVSPPLRRGTFPVEVKGAPRPFSRVVARDEDGEVLWPSGRALWREGRTRGGWSAARVTRLLLWGGIALLAIGFTVASVGEDEYEVRERAERVTASVTRTRPLPDGRHAVDIDYTVDGTRHSGTVTHIRAVEAGTPLTVSIDPDKPTRVWSLTEDRPPDTTDNAAYGGLLLIVGTIAAVAGGLGRRRLEHLPPGATERSTSSWKGLRTQDDRLWYGNARFELGGLVLVGRDGDESLYRWGDPWYLVGAPQARRGISLVLPDGESRPLGRRIAFSPWEELSALAAYLAATPDARPGLTDPVRIERLIRELATEQWRYPHPPDEPLLGDELDLHVASVTVWERHVRTFGGHAVRGEDAPSAEQLAQEVTAQLPAWVRPRVEHHAIQARIRRHLDAGRWPFDVLTSS